jgi:hypothetical protein
LIERKERWERGDEGAAQPPKKRGEEEEKRKG